MSAATDDEQKPSVTIRHPAPNLETLTLDCGDRVLYHPDPERADEWYQVDESHMLELDGRWR